MYVFGLRSLLTLFFTLFTFAAHAKTATSYFLTVDSYDFTTKAVQGEVCKYQANIKKSSGKCLPLNHGTYKLTLFDQEGNRLNREAKIIHKGQKWTYELDASGLDIDAVEIVLQKKSSKSKKHILKTTKIKIRKHIIKLKNGLRKLKSDLKRKKLSKDQFAKQSKKLHSKLSSYKEILLKLDQKIADTNEALASISFPLGPESQSSLKLGFSFENYFFNYSLPQGITTQGSRPEVELTVKNRADKKDICPENSTEVFCQASVGPSQIAINLSEIRAEMMAMTSFMMPAISDLTNVIFTKVGLLNLSELLPNAFKIPFIIDQTAPSFISDTQMIYTKEVSFSATTKSSSAIDPESLIVTRNGVDITSFATVVLSEDQLTATIEVSDPDALEGEHEYQLLISNISQKQSDPYIQNVTVDRTMPVITANIADLINLKQISLPLNITDATLESISVSVNSELIYSGQNIEEITLNLIEGANNIIITAADLAGNENSLTLSTTVDSIAPEIVLNTPSELQKISSTVVTLQGQVSSDASLTINGQNVAVNSGSFSYEALSTSVYTLVATDSAGNSTTLVRNVSVNTVPTIAITVSSDYSIAPATFTFDFSNSHDDGVLTYKILDGQTELISSSNPIVTKLFETAFSKTLTAVVIDELGEKAQTTFSISLQANTAPSVNLSANVLEVYPNDPVNFVITSSDDEAVVSTEFNLGDGTLATLTTNSYTHAYSAIGSYTAQVTVTDRQGLSSTANVSINVVRKNVAPVASFAFDSTIQNPPFNLGVDASSSTDDDGISNYKWRVNGGEWISVTTPLTELPIAQAGNNTIELVVTDSDNVDSEIVSKTYYANMPPVANFTMDTTEGIAPVAVNIDASSSTDDQAVVSYKLETNNETIENTTGKFSYTYSTDGTFEVKVSAIDQFGASSFQTANVVVGRPEPVNHLLYAFFKVQANPDSAELQFLPFSTAPITKAWYETSDGRTINLTEFLPETKSTLIFNSLDPVTVTLHVQTEDLIDTYSMVIDPSVQAEDMPINIDYAIIPGGSNSAIFYLPMIYHPDRSISDALQAQVDFGDGTTEIVNIAEVPYLKHTYATSDSYTTKVSVYSNGELKGELSKVADVFSTLPEGMPLTIITGFKTYQLDMIGADYVTLSVDQSVSLVGDIIGYFWDLGDGTTATGKQAAHFYEKGTYQITLTVVDSLGNSQTISKRIYVFDEGSDLVGGIQCNPTGMEYEVSCDVVFADKTMQISSIDFSTGDGFSTTVTPENSGYMFTNVPYTYADAGSYIVTATAHTTRGESITVDSEVILEPSNQAPVASFECMVDELTHQIMCDSSLSYDDRGITSYMWYVNDVFASDQPLMMYEYPTGGDLNVKLVIGDDVLYTELTKTYFVNEINQVPVANFECTTTNPLELSCSAGLSSDTDGEIVSYIWQVDGEQVEGLTFSHKFTSLGDKGITLTVIDNRGDDNTVEKIFSIKNYAPIADFECDTSIPNQLSCSATKSSDPENGSLDYYWTVANVRYTGEKVVIPFFSDVQSVAVNLSVADSEGLFDSLLKYYDVTYNQQPHGTMSCTSDLAGVIECIPDIRDDDELSYEWYINNVKISTTKILYKTNLISNSIIVKLVVSDHVNDALVLTSTENILEYSLDPHISCKKTSDILYDCSSSWGGTYVGDVDYLWLVDGQEFGNSSEITISGNSNDVKQIDLTITAKNVDIYGHDNIELTFEEIPEVYPSLGVLNSLERSDLFLPLESELLFSFEGANFGITDNKIDNLSIVLNDVELIDVQYIIDGNVLKLPVELAQGENVIHIEFDDDLGMHVDKFYVFYAGSISLVEQFKNTDPNTMVDIHLLDFPGSHFSLKVDELVNIPSTPIVLFAKNDNGRTIQYLDLTKDNNIDLSSMEIDTIVSSAVNELNDLSNWTTSKGSVSLVENDTIFTSSPDADGEVWAHTSIKIDDTSLNGKYLTLPFLFNGKTDEDLVVLKIKNIETQKEAVAIHKVKDLSQSGIVNETTHYISIPIEENGIYEIDFYAKFFEVPSIALRFFDYLFPSANAISDINELRAFFAKTTDISYGDLALLDDRAPFDISSRIGNIPSYMFPSKYADTVVNEVETKYFEVALNTPLKPDVKYYLVFETGAEARFNFPVNSNGTIKIPQQFFNTIFTIEDIFVKIYLQTITVVKDDIQVSPLIPIKPSAYFGNGFRFRILEDISTSLPCDDATANPPYAPCRYGWTFDSTNQNNENKDGTADWISREHAEYFKQLMYFTHEFTKGDPKQIRFNDASSIGGVVLNSQGAAVSGGFKHKDHYKGLGIDVRFALTTEGSANTRGEFILGNNLWISDKRDAVMLENLVNNVKMIDRVNIYFDESNVFSQLSSATNEFSKYLKYGCSSDNRPLRVVAQPTNGHSNHMHVAFIKNLSLVREEMPSIAEPTIEGPFIENDRIFYTYSISSLPTDWQYSIFYRHAMTEEEALDTSFDIITASENDLVTGEDKAFRIDRDEKRIYINLKRVVEIDQYDWDFKFHLSHIEHSNLKVPLNRIANYQKSFCANFDHQINLLNVFTRTISADVSTDCADAINLPKPMLKFILNSDSTKTVLEEFPDASTFSWHVNDLIFNDKPAIVKASDLKLDGNFTAQLDVTLHGEQYSLYRPFKLRGAPASVSCTGIESWYNLDNDGAFCSYDYESWCTVLDPDTPAWRVNVNAVGMICGMWGNFDQDSSFNTNRVYLCHTAREISDDLNYGCGLSYSETLTFIFSASNSVCPETNMSIYSEGIPDAPVK